MQQGTVLGLDLGPNSIGWALLNADFENGEQVRETGLIAAGVRVFEEGVDNFDSSKEASRAQARRLARSARRRQRRKTERRDRLRHLLQQHGLLPQDPHALQEVLAIDPYPLRAKGLDERLTLPELGRVLYHLNQRRGFKSNRKQERGDKQAGEVHEEISSLMTKLAKTGCKTVGQYMYRLAAGDKDVIAADLESDEAAEHAIQEYRDLLEKRKAKEPKRQPKIMNVGRLRIRDRYTDRQRMYEHEFDSLWAAQAKHHLEVLTDELRKRLRDEVIFYQRPFEVTEERLATMPKRANAWRSPTVRRCPFTGEKVLARGHWLAQQFRIWKEVNNLAVFSVDYGGRRELTPDERECVAQALSENRERKFDDLRKALNALHTKLKDDARAPGTDPDQERFNLEEGGRAKLNGNTVEHALIAAIGKKQWPKLTDVQRMSLRLGFSDLVLDEDDPDKFDSRLRDLFKPFNVSAEALAKLAKFHLPEGYMAYSRTAVEKILPRLVLGDVEYDAIRNAGLHTQETESRDKLLAQDLHDLELPNPVVNRALFELRKVVNAIVREYGRPERIIVEMAREMHGGKEARTERSKKMNERNREHDRIAKEVERLGKQPTMSNIKKYMLWEEQDGTCPYTGKKIGVAQIFSGEIQVDHIIPRYRSLDDSLMNRVLSFADANRAKGDRTPYEWVGGTSEHERMLDCVKRMKKMPGNKKARFAQDKFDANEFVSRQLNDTSYIAREAVAYLELLYPPEERVGQKRVGTTRGNLTAELRRQWGLNDILSTVVDGKGEALKTRDDHRHHAVDAVVIALSSRRHLKAYQDYWKRRDVRSIADDKDRPVFDAPWGTAEEFRGNVAGIIEGINVSHRVLRKVRGAFHKAGAFGQRPAADGSDDPHEFVTRKALHELTPSMVPRIRDKRIRELVEARLRETGWSGGKAPFPKNALPDRSNPDAKPIRMDSGVAVWRVRLSDTLTDPVEFRQPGEARPFKFAPPDENHHIEFFEWVDEGGDCKRDARCVRMIDAAERVRGAKGTPRRPLVSTFHPEQPAARLAASLCRGDSVIMRHPKTGKDVLAICAGVSKGSLQQPFYLRFVVANDARRSTDQEAVLCASWKAWDSLTPGREVLSKYGKPESWRGPAKVEVHPLGSVSKSDT